MARLILRAEMSVLYMILPVAPVAVPVIPNSLLDAAFLSPPIQAPLTSPLSRLSSWHWCRRGNSSAGPGTSRIVDSFVSNTTALGLGEVYNNLHSSLENLLPLIFVVRASGEAR